jgi:hypothetical protein
MLGQIAIAIRFAVREFIVSTFAIVGCLPEHRLKRLVLVQHEMESGRFPFPAEPGQI